MATKAHVRLMLTLLSALLCAQINDFSSPSENERNSDSESSVETGSPVAAVQA